MTGTTCELPAFWVLFAAGWLIVLLSTFLINHFELFGLQQAWFNLRGSARGGAAASPAILLPLGRGTRSISGFFLAFWATPHMTAGPPAARGRHVGLYADRHPL